MSLSTTDALNSAIADLVNARLCLLDATETNVREEVEQIESITHYLEDKLVKMGAMSKDFEEEWGFAPDSDYEIRRGRN